MRGRTVEGKMSTATFETGSAHAKAGWQHNVDSHEREQRLSSGTASGRDRRRRTRVLMNTKVRVRLKSGFGDGPDIAHLLDASSNGVAFATTRPYFLGTEVLVTYPYPGELGLTEAGRVVRVHNMREGLWRVAVAIR